MTGVLAGIKVLDLTNGIAGPMAAMLLGDQGASVTRIVGPQDEFADLSGYQVWQRGKQHVHLDVRDPAGRAALIDLVRGADVLIESFDPGVATSLGIDFEQLSTHNDRLVHCSITGYGSTGRLADRPAYDALVAARSGHMWEARGIEGGTLNMLAGFDDPLEGIEVPPGCWVGADRDGPLFPGIPFVSLGACYMATLGISAALRAREITGRGQHVETSLLQGAMASALYPWQRVEHADAPGYGSWVVDPRAPKGFFRCADGRWVHQWVPLPSFILGASRGDRLEITDEVTKPSDATLRVKLELHEMTVLHLYWADMVQAMARFPSAEWTDIASEVGVALQPVRSPEEALDDPLFMEDGCVVELDDGELGPVRQVGQVYTLSACPTEIGQPPDASTGAAVAGAPGTTPRSAATRDLRSPLDGVLVLDLGLAVAGPWGAQLLAELGATVIKVNKMIDTTWMRNHLGMSCNRGKRSIALDVKSPDGMKILRKLIERADVVHHNMRSDAARKLGLDYDSLRLINPTLIYSQLRGYERGPRDHQVAGDQTAAALSGVEWVDGGLDDGGTPLYPITSMGDTGGGSLSAIAIVQALFHRDRTGEGQAVDSSIMYAHMLNNSMAWKTVDGSVVGDRPKLDAMQFGTGPLYRLYRTSDGWLCVAVITDAQWDALCSALDGLGLAADPRFADRSARREHADALGAILEQAMRERSSAELFECLDAAGVPCEITYKERVVELFDDPELKQKHWISSFEHPTMGHVETPGLLVDFSETPGRLWGPTPMMGEHSKEILRELGFDDAEIERLIEEQAVAWTPHPDDEPRLVGQRG